MKSKRTIILYFLLLTFSSCSTVRVLPDGSYRLHKNIIEVVDDKSLKSAELEPYLRQKANTYYFFGWNPFLNIYNWSKSSNENGNNFFRNIGQQPVEFDPDAVTGTLLNMKNHLKSLGYYSSSIEDSIIYNGRRASVYYKVHPGKRFLIDTINYIIQDSTISKLVKGDLHNSLIAVGSFLSEEELAKEADRISALLKENGYFNFSSNYISFTADTIKKRGFAEVTLLIKNYTRNEQPSDSRKHLVFKINKVTIRPDYDPVETLQGAVLNFDTLEYSKDLFFIFKNRLKLRPGFLDQINNLKPGDNYSLSDANNTYDRFNDVNLFTGTNLRFDNAGVTPDSLYGLVECLIRLSPSKRQNYTINLELSSNSNNLFGVSPAITYSHKNLFKGGEWLTLNIMGNFQMNFNNLVRSTEVGFSANLSIPNFLLLPENNFKKSVPRTDFKILYNYQNRPEFTRTLVSAGYGYSWRNGKRSAYTLSPIQLNIVRLTNISASFYQSLENPFIRNSYRNYFDLGAGFTLNYVSANDPKKSISVLKIRWANDLAGNFISIFNNSLKKDTTGASLIGKIPFSQYFKTDFNISWTHKINRGSVIALRFNGGLGYAYGNSKSLPFEKLFFAGGANSMRGWQARSVGPGSSQIDTTFAIPNQTGDVKLEANAEYRFHLFNKFEGALFIDAGNVWTIRRENSAESGVFKFNSFYKSIAMNWGTGLRYDLSFVILRLDLGIIAYNPAIKSWIPPSRWLKRETYSLQFGVGYPF